jgi:putative transposase
LRREGWDLGKNRLYRVYREEGLGLRKKRPWRHVSAAHREERRPSTGPNDVWAMDLVADQLADGRKIRTLTIVYLYTRECLDIDIGFSLRAEDVVRVMNILKVERGLPKRIACDNRVRRPPDGLMGVRQQRRYRLQSPRQAHLQCDLESFNGRFREECLNTHWFESIEDARENRSMEMGLR